MKKRYLKPKITSRKITSQLASRRSLTDSFDGLLELDTSLLAVYCCGSACMPGDTRILLGNGDSRKISELGPGDTVLSWDIGKNTPAINTVAKVLKYQGKDGYILVNNILKLTPNHHVWVNHAEWDEAKRLKPGDIMRGPDGKDVRVVSLEKTEGSFKVYNLVMKHNNHNFFAENLLVHNAERFLATSNCS